MYSFADIVDAFGRLHIGSFTRNSKAAITVDPDADDVLGVALDIAPTRASVARKAGIKFGDFTLTQDPAGTGTLNFGIVDANGVVLATWTAGIAGGSSNLFTKYSNALDGVKYHMAVDTSLLGLAVIDGTTPSDAVVFARANALKAAYASHFASVGTASADGKHKAADTALAATLAAVPAATTVGTTCTLAIALGVALDAHGDSSGVHFHNDAAIAAYSPTSNLLAGNATKALAVTELDALLAASLTHFANGVS